jgi:hypothetical protein
MQDVACAVVLALAVGAAGCSDSREDIGELGTTSTVVSTVAPEMVTVDEVMAALAAAGLPVPNPRDDSAGCREYGCSRLVTTDILSIREWPDPAAAQRWVDAGVDPAGTILIGRSTTVDFLAGGTTPAYDRAAYVAVLRAAAL